MSKVAVTVTIPKRTNSYWQGRGRVLTVWLDMGLVSVEMLTGKCKGQVGGFDLDKVRFHVKREKIVLDKPASL